MGLLDDAIREHLDLKRKRGSDPEEIKRLESEALGPVRREPRSMRAAAQVVDDRDEPHGSGEFAYEDEFEQRSAPSGAGSAELRRLDLDHDHLDDEPEHRRRGFLGRKRREAEPDDEFVPPPSAPRRLPSAPPAGEHEDEYYDDYDPPTHGGSGSGLAAEPPFSAGTPLDAEPPRAPEPPPLSFESAPPVRPHFPDLPSATPSPPADPGYDEFEDEEWVDGHDPHATDTHAAPPPAPPAPPAPAARREPPREEWDDETQLFDVPGHFAREDSARPADPGDEDVLDQTPEFLQDTPDHDRLWFEQKPPKDFDFDG